MRPKIARARAETILSCDDAGAAAGYALQVV
jgi:hypothetical protein